MFCYFDVRLLSWLNNMAENSSFVLCNVLCFLRHKFVNTSVKLLTSALTDFYSVEDISLAKKQLMDDVSKIMTDVKFPHIPQRHDGTTYT